MNRVFIFAFLVLFYSCQKESPTQTYYPASDYYTIVTDTALGGEYVMEMYCPDTFKAGYNKVLVGLRPVGGSYLTAGSVQLKLAPLSGEEILAGIENPVYTDSGLFKGAVMLTGSTGVASLHFLGLSYLQGTVAFDVETTVATRVIQRKTLYTFENSGTNYWLSIVSDSLAAIGPASLEWVLFKKESASHKLLPAADEELTFSDNNLNTMVINTDPRGHAIYGTAMGETGTLLVSVSRTFEDSVLAGPFDFTIYLRE